MQPLMSTGQAARILGVSAQTIRNWVSRGTLEPAATTGLVDLFDPDTIERLRQERAR